MSDHMFDALMGSPFYGQSQASADLIRRAGIGTVSDEMSAITADQLRQIQDRMAQSRIQPSVDWRARREHVAKFKETYVKLRAAHIVLDHQTAIELAKVIYKESETITWEDTQ